MLESVDDGFTGDGSFDVPKIRKNITAMTAMAATTMPNVMMDFFSFFFFASSAGSSSDEASALPVNTIVSSALAVCSDAASPGTADPGASAGVSADSFGSPCS